MAFVQFSKVSLAFGDRDILKNVSINLQSGTKAALTGANGEGKSTLISMIARNTDADINVIGLIGERGREVLDFINRDLGKEGLARSVVVMATSDQPSICRLRAAYVTTAVAEYFRDKGKDVMLMFDSVTRFAQAQREIGLANGEPPAQRGYPPSVFDMIPKLLERAGTNDKGSITAFYTVLVDGDDLNEPITDKVRGTLDGHIILNRRLAQAYHYPAIDVLQSISRLSKRVTGRETQKAVGILRTLMASYANNEMMITTGIYQKGNSAEIEPVVVRKRDRIEITHLLARQCATIAALIWIIRFTQLLPKDMRRNNQPVDRERIAMLRNHMTKLRCRLLSLANDAVVCKRQNLHSSAVA